MKASAIERSINFLATNQILATMERLHSTVCTLNCTENFDKVLAVQAILADIQIGQRRVLGQFF